MAEFKRKPLPDELTAALKVGVRDVPAAIPEARKGEGGGGRKAPPTVQINFNASEDLARLVAKLAKQHGSTRRLFARLLRDAGNDVPEVDLNPVDNRRRWAE
jgi:hypothetical protein